VAEQEVGPGEPQLLTCDATVRDWLLGNARPDPGLGAAARIQPALAALKDWPVAETALWIARFRSDRLVGTLPRIRIIGPSGSGRTTLAACIAQERGESLLVVDTRLLEEQALPAAQLLAVRHARMNSCALAWIGELAEQRPCLPSPGVLQFLICEPASHPAATAGPADKIIEMPMPSIEERRRLLYEAVPSARRWERTDELLGRQRFTVGVIDTLARTRIDRVEDAMALVRDMTRERLGDLVEVLECPFGWEDLVVPEWLRLHLQDIVFEAAQRATFWEDPRARRLFPNGRGLFALFTGETPGVGKTMACQVIAAALDRELYRISLATLTSKWVGETAKNLSRVLSQVPNDEVLLFDEADAAFGKRVDLSDADANARFLNADTNHLLQAVQEYRGVVLMATNKKSDIDRAFIRRLRYVVDFPKPDAQSRLKIWRRIIEGLAGEARARVLLPALTSLAQEVETTGAQIKFAVLSGLFAARRTGEELNIAHLLSGMERELGKEGRAWSPRERERLMSHVG
jgi:AAA+ superfamily predicted ATPase